MPKPLKRHPALIPLSQDHHFGLLLCWKIRAGFKNRVGIERIRNYLNYFFREHLENHFRLEEELLFVYLAKKDLLREDVEFQHSQLRTLFANLSESTEVHEVDFLRFSDELEKHIRFEERIFFPYIQAELQEKKLEDFKESLDQVHQKVVEVWTDEFWVKK